MNYYNQTKKKIRQYEEELQQVNEEIGNSPEGRVVKRGNTYTKSSTIRKLL